LIEKALALFKDRIPPLAITVNRFFEKSSRTARKEDKRPPFKQLQ
jgi:hypothetical protein